MPQVSQSVVTGRVARRSQLIFMGFFTMKRLGEAKNGVSFPASAYIAHGCIGA
jgi:hypothetical protein